MYSYCIKNRKFYKCRERRNRGKENSKRTEKGKTEQYRRYGPLFIKRSQRYFFDQLRRYKTMTEKIEKENINSLALYSTVGGRTEMYYIILEYSQRLVFQMKETKKVYIKKENRVNTYINNILVYMELSQRYLLALVNEI